MFNNFTAPWIQVRRGAENLRSRPSDYCQKLYHLCCTKTDLSICFPPILTYCHARCRILKRNTLQLPGRIKKIVTVIDLIPCATCTIYARKSRRARVILHVEVSKEGVSQFSKVTEVLFGKRFFIRTQTIGVCYSTIFTTSRSSIVDPIRYS